MKKLENEREFYLAVMKFYKESTGSFADSVDLLAEIEEKFPKRYAEFRDFQKDPSKFVNLTEKMKEENVKALFILLKILIRSSTLTQKVQNVLYLDIKEKRKLAKELRSFAEETEKDLEKLKKELVKKEETK